MASDYDDRDDDSDDRDDDRDRRRNRDEPDDHTLVERARRKIATPALLLILAGALGFVIELGALGLSIAAPTLFYDMMVDFIKNQPKSPQQQKQLKDMEDQKEGMLLNSPINIASILVGACVNALTVIGGIKMRSASGYGLSMAGSIAAIIPMGGCCCVTLPFGIWTLVALMNPDVKAGFDASKRLAAGLTDRD